MMISPGSTKHRAFADLDKNSLVDSVVACIANSHSDIILLKEDESVEVVLVKHNLETFLVGDPDHWI